MRLEAEPDVVEPSLLAPPLPGGLLLVPTLVSEDATQRCVRIANLSVEDCVLPSRTPVAVSHAAGGIENDDHHSLQRDDHHRGARNKRQRHLRPPTSCAQQICSRILQGRR